ncbi:aquaporin [Futiania mangrovi]|uniref:Aquaporin n=1 Tax=Futiania mangrovi TaxID=2959716 RepID=A0A9J6PL55_9PROT|nr:aquaporin [Futiania mangrovii]MCP1336778.1 aquaporin [Futiania mangrovii]
MRIFIAEVVGTFWLVFASLGAALFAAGFAPLAIGLCLTLIHLVAIPVSNTSVKPARSFGIAVLDGQTWSLAQLWLFVVAPVAAGIVGAPVYRFINDER